MGRSAGRPSSEKMTFHDYARVNKVSPREEMLPENSLRFSVADAVDGPSEQQHA